MWDFSIQTDHVVESPKTKFGCVDNKSSTYKIIVFAVFDDTRIEDNEKEMIGECQNLQSHNKLCREK